jgi:hypothetical protein
MAEKKEKVEALERDFTLNEKLAIIQTEFKSKKSRFNSFGKYNFRSAEDILEATKPFLLRLGVSVTVNEEMVQLHTAQFPVIKTAQFPVIKSIATIADESGTIKATAIVGVDLDQKGMQMPQKFGSASSYGKKYALGNLFLIDDTQDPDHGKAEPEVKRSVPITLTPQDEAFSKAKEFITNGGTLDTIKKKYSLSSEAEKILQSL